MMIEFCLLYSIDSVENFLTEYFHSSKNSLKHHFDKSFLKRPMKARSILQLPLNYVNERMIHPVYEGPEIEILFEDENFFVFNKPINIFSHPLSYDEKNNCLSYLRSTRPELLYVNESNYDRGLLYRLDFETSGVLIYVKNADSYKILRNDFKTLAKEKKYLCWVEGECKLSGKYKNFFKSTEEKGKKIKVSSENTRGDCQEGELSLLVKKYDSEKNATLMEVILGQGLRHQIRSQLAFLGFPLIGDRLYGGQESERLYLHAYSYTIQFKNIDYQFTSPVIFQLVR